MTRTRALRANRLARLLRETLGGETGAGIMLIASASAAMALANSPLHDGYEALFQGRWAWSPIARLDSLHQWINDGLMAVFFFFVGLEIKRELSEGELADPAQRRLPVIAACAGMITPALCYLAIAGTSLPAFRGWPIPAATDIAFAIGVLALVGPRIPPSVRLFLLTVAIIDDIGAVTIIALFYTTMIKFAWLVAGLAVLAAMFALNRMKITRGFAYVILAIGLWYCVLHSGVHPTVAGVLAALPIPLKAGRSGESQLRRLQHALAPWSGYFIVPLFGLANAGVALGGEGAVRLTGPIPLAIASGLFAGKQVGVFAAIYGCDRLGLAPRPAGASWSQLWGTAMLCGIGFTMSLFIGALAFEAVPALYEEAKLGTLVGSICSALAGFTLLRWGRGAPNHPAGG